MAIDLQRTIEIIFAGVNDVGPTVQSVGRSLQELEGKVGGVTGPMADWTKSILTAETALVGIGAAMAGVAVTQAGQFRESTVEIGTLFNGTGDQVEKLRDQILEYAKGSTSSIEEINGAVYQAISTGTDWQDAIAAVSSAEVLATAGREDLRAVTTLLAGAMNAYGASVDEASDYSDVLFTTVQKGATSLPELASALAGVTSVAAAAQVPFADVNAAIAALTAGGTSTSESVTKLKALLTELLKPSDELSAALRGTSLETDGLDGVMRQLMTATGGNAKEMVKLFGSTEAVQAALVLATDSAGNYAGALKAIEERSGAALTASEKFAKEFDNINQTLLNRIEAMFIQAGLPILDTYADVVDGIGHIFNSLSFSVKENAFQDVYKSIEDGGKRLTELLAGIAAALPEALASVNFEGLLASFGEIGTSIGSLFGDLDLTDADDLATIIQAVVDGVTALTRVTAGAVEGLGPFIRTLADLIDSINKGDEDLQSLVGQVLGFATGVDALLPSLGGLGNVLATVGGAMAVMGGASQAGAAAAGLKGLVLAVAGPGALLAVFGAAVYVIADFGQSVAALADKMEAYRKEDAQFSEANAMTDNWGDMIVKAKELGADVEHLGEAFKETYGITLEQAAGYNSVAEAMDAAAQAARDSATAERESADAKSKQVLANSELTLAEFARAQALEEQQAAQDALKKSTLAIIDQYGDLTKAEWELLDANEKNELSEARRLAGKEGWLKAAADAAKAAEDESKALEKEKQLRKQAADELFRHTQLTYDYQVALEEIASDERFKIIELEFNLELEELRQQGDTARSIIESINTTITSTGETLSSLASNLAGFSSTSSSGYGEMMDLVQAEERRRDEALDLQREITTAQIEQMDAQTDLLRAKAEAAASGEALIKVEAANLTPALELIFDEVLRHTYLKATDEGQDFLLGLTAPGG